MRRWFILLMVVLLPLRGWAGDLMSVQMAAMNAPAHALAAMPVDCAMHLGAHASDDGESSPAHPGGGMKGCSSCALCLPLAELASGSVEAVSLAAHRQPLMMQAAFVSASLAPAVEPPIS